jgi:hypothetical protein
MSPPCVEDENSAGAGRWWAEESVVSVQNNFNAWFPPGLSFHHYQTWPNNASRRVHRHSPFGFALVFSSPFTICLRGNQFQTYALLGRPHSPKGLTSHGCATIAKYPESLECFALFPLIPMV